MQIVYGNRTIEYAVRYSRRKTMEIGVEPPDLVTVVAPEGTTEEAIRALVQTKAKWIVEKLYDVSRIQHQKLNREYVNGESFLYLGRNHTMLIVEDRTLRRATVKLYQGKFRLETPDRDQKRLERAMERWYRTKARERIEDRIQYYQDYFPVHPSRLIIKDQKRRWASCTSKQELIFNWRVVMAPMPVLDYVVVHEMCHLLMRDHSKEFWNMLERILPDYQERREWLRQYGVRMEL